MRASILRSCLTAAISAIPAFAQAQSADHCTGASRPVISLETRDPEIRYISGVTIAQLTTHQRSIVQYRENFAITNGLTRYRVTANYDGQMRMNQAAPWCLSPSFIRLRIQIVTPIEVIIASDYAPGSCAFQVIRQHELMHVAITTREMRFVANEIREKLEDHLRNRFYSGPTPSSAQTAFYRDMQHFLTRAVSYADNYLKQKNAVIDTEDSYRRMQALCSEWQQPPLNAPAQ